MRSNKTFSSASGRTQPWAYLRVFAQTLLATTAGKIAVVIAAAVIVGTTVVVPRLLETSFLDGGTGSGTYIDGGTGSGTYIDGGTGSGTYISEDGGGGGDILVTITQQVTIRGRIRGDGQALVDIPVRLRLLTGPNNDQLSRGRDDREDTDDDVVQEARTNNDGLYSVTIDFVQGRTYRIEVVLPAGFTVGTVNGQPLTNTSGVIRSRPFDLAVTFIGPLPPPAQGVTRLSPESLNTFAVNIELTRATPTPIPTPTPPALHTTGCACGRGDLNLDDVTNATDLYILSEAIRTRNVPPNVFRYGDLNGDNLISVADETLLAQYLVGKSTNSSMCSLPLLSSTVQPSSLPLSTTVPEPSQTPVPTPDGCQGPNFRKPSGCACFINNQCESGQCRNQVCR